VCLHAASTTLVILRRSASRCTSQQLDVIAFIQEMQCHTPLCLCVIPSRSVRAHVCTTACTLEYADMLFMLTACSVHMHVYVLHEVRASTTLVGVMCSASRCTCQQLDCVYTTTGSASSALAATALVQCSLTASKFNVVCVDHLLRSVYG
jgi:hypothetical protein